MPDLVELRRLEIWNTFNNNSVFFHTILCYSSKSFLLIDGYLTAVCTSLFLFCKPKIDQTVLATFSRITTSTGKVVSTMYANELFPTSVRGISLGITVAGSELGGIVAPFLAQYLAKVNHPAAVMCFVAQAMFWVILMHCMEKETKNQPQSDTLENSYEPK